MPPSRRTQAWVEASFKVRTDDSAGQHIGVVRAIRAITHCRLRRTDLHTPRTAEVSHVQWFAATMTLSGIHQSCTAWRTPYRIDLPRWRWSAQSRQNSIEIIQEADIRPGVRVVNAGMVDQITKFGQPRRAMACRQPHDPDDGNGWLWRTRRNHNR